jgi:hypothetical protein
MATATRTVTLKDTPGDFFGTDDAAFATMLAFRAVGVPEEQAGVVSKHRVGEEAGKFFDPVHAESIEWPIPAGAPVGSDWEAAPILLTAYQMKWPSGQPDVAGVCVTSVACKRLGRLVATVVDGALRVATRQPTPAVLTALCLTLSALPFRPLAV